MTTEKTLGQILLGKSNGTLINDKGEYIYVIRYYYKNAFKYLVIFSKGLTEMARKPALNTTIEKKVLKLINDENYQLVK
jgi:uncharacterized SAM-binding protein YcdF (DUF218 family)